MICKLHFRPSCHIVWCVCVCVWGGGGGGDGLCNGPLASLNYVILIVHFVATEPILARWPGVRVNRFVYNLQRQKKNQVKKHVERTNIYNA